MSNTIKLIALAVLGSITMVGIGILIALNLPSHVYDVTKESSGFTHEVTPATVKAIDEYAKRYSIIGAMSLVSLDFQHNLRVSVLEKPMTPEIAERVSLVYLSLLTIPIFTESAVQNAEMSALINGKFNCRPAIEGAYVKIFNLEKFVAVTCRIPISPEVGRLVGYMAIHLVEQPSAALKIRLEEETRLLAYTVYYNEFVPAERRR